MEPSNWLKKIIMSQGIKFAGGKVSFKKVPMFLFPTYAVALLIKLAEQKDKDVLYELGYKQGKRCAEHIEKTWGFKKNINIFCQHSDMMGIGRMQVVRADHKNLFFVIKMRVSSVAEEILRYFGLQKYPVDHYIRGIWVGIIHSVLRPKKEIFCIETKCKAKGDSYCEFIIREKCRFDFNDPQIKRQNTGRLSDIPETQTRGFLQCSI